MKTEKEYVMLKSFNFIMGLRFKKRSDCVGKVFVFEFKKPKAWIDIDTLFMRFPVKVTLWYQEGVVASFIMKPYSLKVVNGFVFDKITEEVA